MSVNTVGSSSMHRFSYDWRLEDLKKVKKNGLKVFSCFSCGGGSSMGYKLAGFDVIGNCEIDVVINEIYKVNNKPKYNFRKDIRDFINIPDEELPGELFDLDILDGSPPCSTFSISGDREASWGKNKKFREGQAMQTLDDLFFEYIKAVKKLKPKVFVAENVKGLLLKNARGYVNQIIHELDECGYTTQIFLLNSATMGVPQKRERVFVIGHKKEYILPILKLKFCEKSIRYKDFKDSEYLPVNVETMTYKRWKQRELKDINLYDTVKRTESGKVSGFNTYYVKDNSICNTLTASTRLLRFDKPGFISDRDVCLIQSFPLDYDFGGQDPCYVCGMSVPPVMMANIATEIYEQWFKNEDQTNKNTGIEAV